MPSYEQCERTAFPTGIRVPGFSESGFAWGELSPVMGQWDKLIVLACNLNAWNSVFDRLICRLGLLMDREQLAGCGRPIKLADD